MKLPLAHSRCRPGPAAREPGSAPALPRAGDAPHRPGHRCAIGLRVSLAALGLVLACAAPVSTKAVDYYNLNTDYQNYWFWTTNGPGGAYTNFFSTNASTLTYGGHVLGNTNATLPKGGNYGLETSSFGQSVQSIQADLALGEVITAPAGVNTNLPPANFVAVSYGDRTNAYYQSTNDGTFYVPSTGQVIAGQANNITILWITTSNTINAQSYNVDSVPKSRPARLFWTEDPYLAPAVSLDGLFPVIHYNAQVAPPVYEVVTNVDLNGSSAVTTNILAGVWYDKDSKQLRAKNVTGTFLLEYYQTGTYAQQVQPQGIEVVQVMAPSVQIVKADVGSRLMPVETYWAELDSVNGVIPNVTEGLNTTVYLNDRTGPKDNWAFSIKRTYLEPWSAEIYWQHRGVMGVLWPYEVDWFSCNWTAYPQLMVLGDASTDQAPALIPKELTAEMQADMEPASHAQVSATGRSIATTQPGTCLVKYTSSDNVWFETIQTVGHTNFYYFDLEPREWPIGEELTPGDDQTYAIGFDGVEDYVSISESYLNLQTNWTVSLWFKVADFRAATLYSEGDSDARFKLNIVTNGQFEVGMWNKTSGWRTAMITHAPLQAGRWQYVTLTYSSGSDTNGTLRLYLDDFVWTTNQMPRVHFDGAEESALLGACLQSSSDPTNFCYGKIDQLRIWDVALTSDQIHASPYTTLPETAGSLVADYEFNEGQGQVIQNAAGDKYATACAGAFWCYGQVVPGGTWSGYPGYIHLAEGDRYNVNRYNYPTELDQDSTSHLFGVNTGSLEVWWARRSRQTDMPAVYYPCQVVRYENVWPSSPPQIVIASGLGSGGDSFLPAEDALSFDGSPTNYVTVPSSAALDVGNELTIEAWVKLDRLDRTNKIASWISGYTTNGAGFELGVCRDKVDVEFWTGVGSGIASGYASSTRGSVASNTWTHIAYTFKANDSNSVVIYVNGEAVYTNAAIITQPIKAANSALYLGRASWSTSYNTLGRIGEVRVWNVARTADDLAASYLTRLRGDESGLVAYYPFVREVDSTVLADAGPFGLQGVVTGATWTSPGREVRSSGPLVMGAPSIYSQNDASLHGYNPNEEHALVMDGVAYALRDDLNLETTSKAYVLVDYLDPTSAQPKMAVFSVLETNELYTFNRTLLAGKPILPPMPLGAMPLCANNSSCTWPSPAWKDRKNGWWAVSAGNDGGTAEARMHFYYQMQPTFYFPDEIERGQYPVGAEVPWLPRPSDHGGDDAPVPVVYTISWTNVPTMQLGQTLTEATAGLPEIWGQLSVDVIYEQSVELGQGQSVDLFDPVVSHGVDLDSSVVNEMISSQLARRESTSPRIRFLNVSPSLNSRLYYDPNRGAKGQLVICGQYEETLTGGGYLLLNMLEDFERDQVHAAATGISSKAAWDKAVDELPRDITPIEPNESYVHAALGARLSGGAGYVTMAFNNSTNSDQVPTAQPISVTVIQVTNTLYAGDLEVILPGDVLAEQLSLRYSADLAGHVSECEFRWRWVEPEGGLIPNTEFDQWSVYGLDSSVGTNEVTLTGASPFTLSDHYFAVQYRPKDTSGPSGTNWSAWSYNLAQGWVKRVMNGVNPFLQMLPDMTANGVDTRLTMISQAGAPYEGDVALNMDSVSQAGLIPVYETVFNRAKDFSIRAGLNDPSMNETLLYAASRLRDLYMLLGNEAYADAMDPTIAFPQELSLDTHGGMATSIFPFMNQVPTLLDEELALLRGRDDTLSPPITNSSPVYNRLMWNFTSGINGGEPAYAYNYNIRGNPSNTVGTITAEDAKRLYPQGHGDAWGHYLSAISHYYDLLSYANFGWQTEPSATLVGNTAVSTDFFDEQKFAETAAARARVGVAIVKQTARKLYSEAPVADWKNYTDSNTDRAWGVGEWATRAGQAVYYDWVVANSLMYDSLTNLTQIGGSDAFPEGIQKIDRTSTPELAEMTASLRDIQTEVDSADHGLNPLGLARNVVPFDIDPTAIDAGQTHFEQVYDRALQAAYNSCVAFDQARSVNLELRKQFDSVYDLQESLSQNETDYQNRLIELYGYPYADDIGPDGTYPEGYDGPDLINWQILDLEDFMVHAPTGQVMKVDVVNLGFIPGSNFEEFEYEPYLGLTNTAAYPETNVCEISVCMSDNGLKLKQPGWVGRRRAQGELQLALSDYVQTWYVLEAKMKEYEQTMYGLEVELEHRQADYSRYPYEWQAHEENAADRKDTSSIVEGLKITKEITELVAESIKTTGEATADMLPDLATGVEGFFPTMSSHVYLSKPLILGFTIAYYASKFASSGLELGIMGREGWQEREDIDLEAMLKGNEYQSLLRWTTADTQVKLKEQYVKQAELLSQVEALTASYERVQKLVAEGDRLIIERAQVRARAAQRIQTARYTDLGFRIFRDDALRRYQQAFNLAARYTYLAAKAYDYETGLLHSDTARTPGSKFLEAVVRARAPGRFYTWLGTPMVGGSVGEPGLADVLARMKADWDVVKGRFGFNNPDTETSRFSLRTELFRIAPGSEGDSTWAQVLENSKVVNLHEVKEFKRYCRPYTATTNVEPALVIPFSTFVVAGQNYFGWPLAGGDNAYDASHAATKVRSAGVWFVNYDTTFNTNAAGSGLANQPNVYLIPVGEDLMRSPTRNATRLRHWQVLDQAIPLPYDVGGADIDNPDWLPVVDSLREPLAQIRRFAAFRAYHDAGEFDSSETCTNGRLVGRSVWNTRWLLIIPGRTLLSDPAEGLERFIYGPKVDGVRDNASSVKDIKIFFQTYSISGD